MDEKKLGTESAYPTICYEQIMESNDKFINITDAPGMSKRLVIAMNFATVFAKEYFDIRHKFNNPTEIIKIAYEFADELLKQENSD